MRIFGTGTLRLSGFVFLALILPLASFAQSTEQNFPTPVTTSEINGTIKARDLGDARLTSYYYAFDGAQGDIFINVVTKNFSGDIDVFNADRLRPLTKMVIYADSGISETGRLIYLRKGERLILRIEGRPPNDDPAVFRIKFGGSFIALAGQKAEEAPTVARSGEIEESGIRVNSVGTIIPTAPKPPPTRKPKEVVKETVSAKLEEAPKTEEIKPITEPVPADKSEDGTKAETVFENKTAKVTVESTAKPSTKRPPRTRTATKTANPSIKKPKPPVKTEETMPDPLASIRLIVQLKDGNVIERPMSEVFKFSVDKGVLTVILKDGKISRFSILDVAKVTIE